MARRKQDCYPAGCKKPKAEVWRQIAYLICLQVFHHFFYWYTMEAGVFINSDQLVVIFTEKSLYLLEQTISVCFASSCNFHDILCINETAFSSCHTHVGSEISYKNRGREV